MWWYMWRVKWHSRFVYMDICSSIAVLMRGYAGHQRFVCRSTTPLTNHHNCPQLWLEISQVGGYCYYVRSGPEVLLRFSNYKYMYAELLLKDMKNVKLNVRSSFIKYYQAPPRLNGNRDLNTQLNINLIFPLYS